MGEHTLTNESSESEIIHKALSLLQSLAEHNPSGNFALCIDNGDVHASICRYATSGGVVDAGRGHSQNIIYEHDDFGESGESQEGGEPNGS